MMTLTATLTSDGPENLFEYKPMSTCSSMLDYSDPYEYGNAEDARELLQSLRPLMDEIDIKSDMTADIIGALSTFSNGVICEDTVRIMILKDRKVITLSQVMALIAVL